MCGFSQGFLRSSCLHISVLGWAVRAAEDCETEGGERCWGELWGRAEVMCPGEEMHGRICAEGAFSQEQ